MAAIERESALGVKFRFCLFALAALNVVSAAAPTAGESPDGRAQVAAVAEALSAGDVPEAMTHFSKSLPDYEKLKRYFEGLTAFQIENQLNITDEEDSDKSVALTITWDITLTDLGTDRSSRRTGEIHAKLASVDSKWRIVEFAPLEIFNPQLR